MGTKTLSAQDVNGDPFVSGGNINIVNNSESSITFTEVDFQLGTPVPGETVSLDGGTTQLTYEFLGFGNVRGDPLQYAAFIRVDLGDGTFQTLAIDMNNDGDQLPNLQTGNTQLTVADLDSASSAGFPAPACFVAGTRLVTAQGEIAVEDLRAGAEVLTRDNGFQTLRGVYKTTVPALGNHAPVIFDTGAIGNREPLALSQAHGVLISDWRSDLLFGESEVLVPAAALVNGVDVRIRQGGPVTYYHCIFDTHVMVNSAGIWSESFQLGAQDAGNAAAQELAELFPDKVHAAVRTRARGKSATILSMVRA